MKYFIFLFLFILLQQPVFSFDKSRYTQYSLDEINKEIDAKLKELEEGKREKGITIFDKPYAIKIILNKYPIKNNNNNIYKELNYFAHNTNYYERYGEGFINIFGYYIDYQYKNKAYSIAFQSVLNDYIKKEVSIGDTIILFLIHGTYDDSDNTTYLFVNEFETIEKKKKP